MYELEIDKTSVGLSSKAFPFSKQLQWNMFFNPFKASVLHHIETSKFTGDYMMKNIDQEFIWSMKFYGFFNFGF